MEELQTQRFEEQAKEILGEECRATTVFNQDTKMVISAKINCLQPLTNVELAALMDMAHSFYFKGIKISRSGAGLRVDFEKFNSKPIES